MYLPSSMASAAAAAAATQDIHTHSIKKNTELKHMLTLKKHYFQH